MKRFWESHERRIKGRGGRLDDEGGGEEKDVRDLTEAKKGKLRRSQINENENYIHGGNEEKRKEKKRDEKMEE